MIQKRVIPSFHYTFPPAGLVPSFCYNDLTKAIPELREVLFGF